MFKFTKISSGKYDTRGYTNEESIANLQLTDAVPINSFLTYNFGMDDDRFPLLFMTEGKGKSGSVEVSTTQWTWATMGRMKFTDMVTHFEGGAKPGIGGSPFIVHFATHLIIEQYGLVAPDSTTQCRVQRDLGQSAYGYAYELVCTNPNPNYFVNPELLEAGKYWSMSAPTVSESYSKGNRSNTMGPGKMTSQLEYHRYSQEIAGDSANTVTKYEFKNGKGGTSNLWMNEVMRQFHINMRVMNEERLWIAEYNRNAKGEITLKDNVNGKPIPHTAGMLEICRESNYDTYGERLTINKIKRTVGDVLDRDTDSGSMEIILMAGKGFCDDFDMMLKREAKDNSFFTPLGDKVLEDSVGGMSYGNYFRQYKTIEGHKITLKHCSYFDKGTIAEAAKQNGMIHPMTGLPITSHQAAFIDFSTYDGVQNVRVVRHKNRSYKAKVVRGMSDIPASWGIPDSKDAATDIDNAQYHVMHSLGLQVNNSNKMFMLASKL